MISYVGICACVYIRAVVSEDDRAIFTLADKLAGLAAYWRRLGLQLDIAVAKLDAIETVVGADPVATKMRDMLRYWIDNGARETRTWGFLAEAVGKADNNALAFQIRRRTDYKQDAPGLFLDNALQVVNCCGIDTFSHKLFE